MKGVSKIYFYRHWFIDQHGDPICSGWVYHDWYDYMYEFYRDERDKGEDSTITLLQTDKKGIDL